MGTCYACKILNTQHTRPFCLMIIHTCIYLLLQKCIPFWLSILFLSLFTLVRSLYFFWVKNNVEGCMFYIMLNVHLFKLKWTVTEDIEKSTLSQKVFSGVIEKIAENWIDNGYTHMHSWEIFVICGKYMHVLLSTESCQVEKFGKEKVVQKERKEMRFTLVT